jgi:hypothetical protein
LFWLFWIVGGSVSQTICPGWLHTAILPISASRELGLQVWATTSTWLNLYPFKSRKKRPSASLNWKTSFLLAKDLRIRCWQKT